MHVLTITSMWFCYCTPALSLVLLHGLHLRPVGPVSAGSEQDVLGNPSMASIPLCPGGKFQSWAGVLLSYIYAAGPANSFINPYLEEIFWPKCLIWDTNASLGLGIMCNCTLLLYSLVSKSKPGLAIRLLLTEELLLCVLLRASGAFLFFLTR